MFQLNSRPEAHLCTLGLVRSYTSQSSCKKSSYVLRNFSRYRRSRVSVVSWIVVSSLTLFATDLATNHNSMGPYRAMGCQSGPPHTLGRPNQYGHADSPRQDSGTMKDAMGGAWLHDRVAGTAKDTKSRLPSEDLEAYVCSVAPLVQSVSAAINVVELEPIRSIDLAPSATCTMRFAT